MSDDQQRKKDKAEIKLFLKRLAIFVVAMVILFGFVFRIVVMPSDDMKPAIRIGDIELVYCLPSTKRVGQVVYYKEDRKKYTGRIVAGPKDTVSIQDETLYINGNPTSNPSIYYETPAYEGDVKYPLTLKEDEYFVLSDFREGAVDSRSFGPVNKSQIIGTVITIIRRSQI